MNYRDILVETHGRVGVIRLNRPQRMNALNDALAAELAAALAAFDADGNIGFQDAAFVPIRRGREWSG